MAIVYGRSACESKDRVRASRAQFPLLMTWTALHPRCSFGCSFRGTGVTTYLLNEGTLELAQEMANHSSPRTTKLYDRRSDKITQEAIERIRIE